MYNTLKSKIKNNKSFFSKSTINTPFLQPPFTCSKSTMKKPEQCAKTPQS